MSADGGFRKRRQKGQVRKALLSFAADVPVEGEDEEFVARKTADKKGRKRAAKAAWKGSEEQTSAAVAETQAKVSSMGGWTSHESAMTTATAGLYTPEALAELKSGSAKAAAAVAEGKERDDEARGEEKEEDSDEMTEEQRQHVLRARRARQRARALGQGGIPTGPEGFIPLSGESKPAPASVEDDEQGPRLVREEDVEELPETGTIRFGAPARRSRKPKPSIIVLDTDDEEEENEDEEEALDRGAGGESLEGEPGEQSDVDDGVGAGRETEADIELLRKSIHDSLVEEKSNHERKRRELDRLELEIHNKEEGLARLGQDLKNMNSRYQFYQQVRDELKDMLDCLACKAPLIDDAANELEDSMRAVSHIRSESRKQRVVDEEEEAFGSHNSMHQEHEHVGGGGEANEGAPVVDEFGRDIHYTSAHGKDRRLAQIRERRARQEARRRLRRDQRLQQRQQQAQHPFFPDLNVANPDELDPEGWSTESDTEIQMGVERAEKKQDEILEAARRIFADTDDRFASLNYMRDRLQLWKTTFARDYNEAFIALHNPALFAPYVRFELLHWRPLQQTTFEAMHWYSALLDFSHVQDDSTADADYNLIPKLVEKIIVPRLVNSLEMEFDPHSRAQLRPAIEVVQETLVHLGDLEHTAAADELRDAVLRRLRSAVNQCAAHKATISAELLQKQAELPLDHESLSHFQLQLRFVRSRWWFAFKLLANVVAWSEVLGADAAFELVTSLVSDSLLPHFLIETQLCIDEGGSFMQPAANASRVARMLAVLTHCVPRAFFETSVAAGQGLGQFSPAARSLVDFLETARSYAMRFATTALSADARNAVAAIGQLVAGL